MKLSFYLLILNCFFLWLLLKTETLKMNKLHKKLYFFGLKANLDWNFRVGLFGLEFQGRTIFKGSLCFPDGSTHDTSIYCI